MKQTGSWWFLALILGAFLLGAYSVWDGQQPHPERSAPSANEWAWQ
jgi:hypothetical protein